ncbi:MAG: type II toxin-antitoxin system HicB family antitoxin [Clostridia bacterium]|nr:type II toxin-antitoxin system HicB family antitoxin [Clostridia bacterium]
MKKFVYPAVVYYDEDNKIYLMYIDELGIGGDGLTMEECNSSLCNALMNYVITALRYDLDIPAPQEYESVVKNNSNNKVMLISIDIDERKIKKLA